MSKRTNIKLGLECELANHSTKSGNFYGLILLQVELERKVERVKRKVPKIVMQG